MSGPPKLIFLAGPNGAGKSTFYEAYLSQLGLPIVNADALAATLNLSVSEAAAVADRLREELVQEGTSFITETVFSDPVGAKLEFLKQAMSAGYHVTLIFIGIAGPALSEARVIARGERGGHEVPSEKLDRRYRQSLKNLAEALTFVSEALVFDNSSSEYPYNPILKIKAGSITHRAEQLPKWVRSAIRGNKP